MDLFKKIVAWTILSLALLFTLALFLFTETGRIILLISVILIIFFYGVTWAIDEEL